jgi:hypothetical protein
MPNTADGRYDHKPWDAIQPGGIVAAPTSAEKNWNYLGPFASNQERLTQQALTVATMSRDDILRDVRPVLPQIRQFPDRFIGASSQPTIEDVVSLDRAYNEPRANWFSGGDMSGSSRNSLEGV